MMQNSLEEEKLVKEYQNGKKNSNNTRGAGLVLVKRFERNIDH
jgi:hypothetical protein